MRYKTWITVNKDNAANNFDIFRQLADKDIQLWAVVKSNAYGHGLLDFSLIADRCGIDGFCVDSVIEGIALRKAGIKKLILVLGPTLPELLPLVAESGITISISSIKDFEALASAKPVPDFHLKIDTGMRRQGIYVENLGQFIKLLQSSKPEVQKSVKGLFTHFASAKDVNYPTFTEKQFNEFLKAADLLEANGFKNLIKHAAATSGALINKKYHLDAIRLGIGLYGLWPSKELEEQLGRSFSLNPVLSWRTLVSDVKNFKKGDYFGYDLTERADKDGKFAVLPIGYWHGLDRGLSGCGYALIGGKKAKIIGRVSMDLTIVDVTGINCQSGDEAVIIGEQGAEVIGASDIAAKLGTTHYEVITRINPLIQRIVE